MKEKLGDDIDIVSKLESLKGVKNIFDIMRSSAAVMLARGDLLMELSYYGFDIHDVEEIIYNFSKLIGCPIIIATRIADSLETQDYMTPQEVLVLEKEIKRYIDNAVFLLANETTVDENKSANNIKIINSAINQIYTNAL